MMPPTYDKERLGPASSDEYAGSDPADRYALLDRPYDGALPNWGGRDYGDPTLIAGRPRSSYMYLIVLLFAAGADIGAFFQIIELVLAQDPLYLVYIVVFGFTATALSLAHRAGALSRDRVAGAAWVGKIMPLLCGITWLLLGIAAFYVRITLLATSITGPLSFSLDSPSVKSGSYADQSAIVFLALYLATGLVTWMGAYLSRNPLAESYKMASRAFVKARLQVDSSSVKADSAEAVLDFMRTELAAAEKTLEYEIKSRLALAEKLRLAAYRATIPETGSPWGGRG
jgi:hypothetical protein